MDSSSRKTKSGYILEEIIIEILSRLPVKTLLRFKCVCKLWKSLISDPTFIRKHLSSTINNFSHHHLLYTNNAETKAQAISMYSLLSYRDHVSHVEPTRPALELDKDRLRPFTFVGTCDGLVLILLKVRELMLLLWNPSTRETKILPNKDEKICVTCCHHLGFGYDHLSNDYKVIMICYCQRDKGNGVWLYSLRMNSWRRIQDFPWKLFSKFYAELVSRHNLVWLRKDVRALVSFDLVKETFEALALPQEVQQFHESVPLLLGVLDGKLCTLHHGFGDLHIWVMQEFGVKESWSKQFRFPFPKDAFHFAYYVRPLCMLPNDEVVLHFQQGVAIYKSKGRSCRAVLFGKDSLCAPPQVYMESLISINY